MTRAEKARHYLLHEHRSPLNDIMHQADLSAEKQYCTDIENAYLAGYQQAEKDTIEMAISWLKKHANEYIVDVGVGYGENGRNVELIVGGMCWEHLKKAMEDEQ